MKTTPRVRAPRLQGRGGWLNVDAPLSLEQLRGKIVVLDFWTFCCANCLHVIDELRPLEARYPDDVVVIGIHSPKFAHETEHAAVAAAVQRYGVRHPVLDDPDLSTWQQYAVHAWPTLVVIDPQGYVVASAAGEGQASALDAIIADLIATHSAAGTLKPGPLALSAPSEAESPLWFPAKVIVLPAARTGRAADSLLIADAGRHRLVEQGATSEEGTLRVIGAGGRGRRDGEAERAEFAEPNGLTLLPLDLARAVGYDVLVADTANHALRGVRLADGRVSTVADLRDTALATVAGPVPGVASPWDVAWWPALDRAVVAAAGVHLLLSFDPRTQVVALLAGTTVEGLRDGPALDGWLAQPSGLAVDGERLWFVDAETSALRWLDADQVLHTAIGEGLFDFGHVDGAAAQARLQHPLGVAVLPDGRIAIADTYNGAVRCFDPTTGQVSTLATSLAEPSGLVVVGAGTDDAAPDDAPSADALVVVESTAHRLTTIEPTAGSTATHAVQPAPRPVTVLRAGEVRLRVLFTPAPGRTVDDRFGPATRLSVEASAPGLLLDGSGTGIALDRVLVLAEGEGVLQIGAQAASCDHDPAIDNPACYLARQDWGIPVRVVGAGGEPDASSALELPLLG